jgi:transposase
MKTTATPKQTAASAIPGLCMAIESGAKEWKLFFSTGLGQHPRQRTVAARRLDRLAEEISRAKAHFGLVPDAPVSSCYEAGRDGFWLHRALVGMGIENRIVDSSSIEVNRKQRRAKTDRVDGQSLLRMLWRYHNGEKTVFRTVQVPSEAEEDERQLHRELVTTKRDRADVVNRIKGLLFGQGIYLTELGDLAEQLPRLRCWNGKALGEGLLKRIQREWGKVVLLAKQISELEKERRRLLKEAKGKAAQVAGKLIRVRGIGENAGWLYSTEFFAWREFRNRRQVGGLSGLAGTPYQSGNDSREQGMSKAGNRWVRGIAIEIAWGWLRYQPESELTRWYQRRFGHGSSRVRRIGIVALARKLLIELWKYLETGTPPAGALLKG